MDYVFLELKLNFFTKLFDFVFIRKTYFSIQQGIGAFKYILFANCHGQFATRTSSRHISHI